MRDDFKQPLATQPSTGPTDSVTPEPAMPITQQPINGQSSGLVQPKRFGGPFFVKIIAIIAVIIASVMIASIIWYNVQLSSPSDDTAQLTIVKITPGTSPDQIGNDLKEKGLIRSTFAFNLYTRLTDTRGSLQAGTYRLSPGESTSEIVEHLTNGKVDEFSITFYPGATLAEHREALLLADFEESEIDAAFAATYDSPIFNGKPASADLEGYIYGETYQLGTGATVNDILQFSFDEYARVIAENKLVESFKARGLSLFDGITLASIVQREALTSDDQKQVAQVFYTRLGMGMQLGSDVTFIYAAEKLGVEPISTLDSPYNTRINVGLPPGPIASPGLSALMATANPAQGDYVYFVAGDDGRTYFGRTIEEHERNIAKHCTVECNKP